MAGDLLKIRAINGSQHFAFEELCCQLAALDPRPSNAKFIRKGPGADAGVECYVRYADGSEAGWQAKFFDGFGNSQLTQLTESFNQAIAKHPRLTCYFVCLPIDLKDGRVGRGKSEGQRWNDWCDARLAELSGRSVDIQLLQATDLRERLYRNDPNYAGRMLFFFDEHHLTPSWFQTHFKSSCNILGARYSPAFHVTLPIRKALSGIARDGKLDEARDTWIAKLRKQTRSLESTLLHVGLEPGACKQASQYGDAVVSELAGEYSPTDSYPLDCWQTALKEFSKQLWLLAEQCWELPKEEKTKDRVTFALRQLSELRSLVDEIIEELSDTPWQLANKQAVLLYGDAGVGKSHLLADVASDTLKAGRPAILLINSQFFLSNPHTQILQLLDLNDVGFSSFLGALDAAGQARGCRALLMIDALNERHGIELWQEHLAGLISEISKFHHLALVVSCRTTYLESLLSESSYLRDHLAQTEHHGFADGGGRAARAYLTIRKIVRPSVPNLLPEFNNPLFLKTCCDSLEREGMRAFPLGLQGVTQYYEFYVRSLTKQVERRMKLDTRQRVVERALSTFVGQLISKWPDFLPVADVIKCFDSILPSLGQSDRSLLTELEHEGVLTVEVMPNQSGTYDEQVRFTFERFGDFQIALNLLHCQQSGGYALSSFDEISPLGQFLKRDDLYRYAGILEALAVLLPEKTGLELPDLASTGDWTIRNAFLNSLLLRKQSHFTTRTRELTIGYSDSYEDHWMGTLVSITSEPDNPFNAKYLHERLARLTMPERDARWSIDIAEMSISEGSPLDNVISWALDAGFDPIEPERAELASIFLAWLLATSNRTIRDRATKALSSLLSTRLPLAKSLIEKFRHVDDLYIHERVLGACYGATLQALDLTGLDQLVASVFEWQFADRRPSLHLLLRDYARGICEYGAYKGLLPEEKIAFARPPYVSSWPIEYVSKNDLAKYTDDYNGHIFRDEITSSAGSEWTGDFAKYVIAPAVHHWTATPLKEKKAKSPSESWLLFCEEIVERRTPEAAKALDQLLRFCVDLATKRRDEGSSNRKSSSKAESVQIKITSVDDKAWEKRKETEKVFKEMEEAFLSILSPEDRYSYRTQARGYFFSLMFGGRFERPAPFDETLAQRWVTKRAHDMGWSKELHGKFDRHVGSGRGRSNKHIERIGKKYQWLALYELLARMADNLIFRSSYSDDDQSYAGPWQTWDRDLDPSLLISKTMDDGWEQHPAVWWSPIAVRLKHLSHDEQRLWLENDRDQLNSPLLVDVIDPESQRQWLVLRSFRHHDTPHGAGPHTDSWCRIWCVVTKKEHQNRLVNALGKHTLIDPNALPDAADLNHAFVGEYPWHPACSVESDWTSLDHDYGYRLKVLPTVVHYEAEATGRDKSLDDHVRIYLPAPWIIRELGVRLTDGRSLGFTSSSGEILFKDPSISEGGPSAALVDKQAFLDFLDKENLAPIWVIAGEKGAYGEGDGDFVGRRVHSFVYTLTPERQIVCAKKIVEFERPQS